MNDPARKIPFLGDVEISDWIQARDIAREYMPPEHDDMRRWEHDASRIRRALALPGYLKHAVLMDCFNCEDANQIKQRLTTQELARVSFRYGIVKS